MKHYPNTTGNIMSKRGYFGIGILNLKTTKNIGTLWRSAQVMGADFIFTVEKRYEMMRTDTMKSWKHTPLFQYNNIDAFFDAVPMGCKVIAIELDESSVPLAEFEHPERAIYLLGAEDYGIPKEILKRCNDIVQLPGNYSQNVSVVGGIVLYDRFIKTK